MFNASLPKRILSVFALTLVGALGAPSHAWSQFSNASVRSASNPWTLGAAMGALASNPLLPGSFLSPLYNIDPGTKLMPNNTSLHAIWRALNFAQESINEALARGALSLTDEGVRLAGKILDGAQENLGHSRTGVTLTPPAKVKAFPHPPMETSSEKAAPPGAIRARDLNQRAGSLLGKEQEGGANPLFDGSKP